MRGENERSHGKATAMELALLLFFIFLLLRAQGSFLSRDYTLFVNVVYMFFEFSNIGAHGTTRPTGTNRISCKYPKLFTLVE